MIEDYFKDFKVDITDDTRINKILRYGVEGASNADPAMAFLLRAFVKSKKTTPPPAPETRIDNLEDEHRDEQLIRDSEEQTDSLDNIDENTKNLNKHIEDLNKRLLELINRVEDLQNNNAGNNNDSGFPDLGAGGDNNNRRGGRLSRAGAAISEFASNGVVRAGATAAAAGALGYGGMAAIDSTEAGHDNFIKPIRSAIADIAEFLGMDDYAAAQRDSLTAREQTKLDPQNAEYEKQFLEDLKTQKMTRKKAEYYMQANPGLIIPEENIIEEPENTDTGLSAAMSYSNTDPNLPLSYDIPTNNDAETARLNAAKNEKLSTDELKKTTDREEEKIDLFTQIRDALLLMLAGVGNAVIGPASAGETNEGDFSDREVVDNSSSAGTATAYAEKEVTGQDVTVGSNKALTKHKSSATNFIEWVGEADSGKHGHKSLSVVYGQPKHGQDLTTMTVGEVRQKQRAWKADNIAKGRGSSAAAGTYQLMDYTIDDLLERGVIKKDDKFDKETQQKAAKWLATQKGGRKPVRDWLKAKKDFAEGKITEAEYAEYRRKAAESLASEWAALPDPDRGGRSHYAGDGINGATRNLEQTYEAMDKLPFSWEESRTATKPQDDAPAIIDRANAEAKVEQNANSFINGAKQDSQSATPSQMSPVKTPGPAQPISLSANDTSQMSSRNNDNTITRLVDKYFSYGVA